MQGIDTLLTSSGIVYHSRRMVIDSALLKEALEERDRTLVLQHETEQAQVRYQHTIRRLHASGASLREIADALGVSYQRVHQIVDVGAGRGALKQSTGRLECSFCATDQRQTKKVIAGPDVYICDQCVDLANEVIAEAGELSNELTRLAVETDTQARCSFCGKRHREIGAVVTAPDSAAVGKFGRRRARRHPGVRICRECLELCNEILTTERH